MSELEQPDESILAWHCSRNAPGRNGHPFERSSYIDMVSLNTEDYTASPVQTWHVNLHVPRGASLGRLG